jgi:hypothetical protein
VNNLLASAVILPVLQNRVPPFEISTLRSSPAHSYNSEKVEGEGVAYILGHMVVD